MGGNRLVLLSRYLPKRFAAIAPQSLKHSDGITEPITLMKYGCYGFAAHSTPDSKPEFAVHPPFSEYTDMVGHSNGIICLRIYYGEEYSYNDDDVPDYVVWNPLTNEYKFVPPSPIPPPSNVLYRLPCFSFDRRNSDCKLLQLAVYYNDRCSRTVSSLIYQYGLYSLKKNSWREITGPGPSTTSLVMTESGLDRPVCEDGVMYWKRPVCLGGVAYWMGYESERGRRVIAAFDFGNECFYSLPFPEIITTRDGCPYLENCLMDYDGSLSVVTSNSYGSAKRYEIRVQVDAGAWEKVSDFTIDGGGDGLRLLEFWKKDAVLFIRYTTLFSLDLTTKVLKNLGTYYDSYIRYEPSRVALNDELVPYVPETSVLRLRYLQKSETEPLLLLRRRKDGRRIYYFTALSSRDFTPEFDIDPPFPALEPGPLYRRAKYPYPTYTVGHSNGVFCLRTSDPVECVYQLWNPLTKEHIFLPPSPHPSALARLSSFSFDGDNLDCKVLQLVVYGEPEEDKRKGGIHDEHNLTDVVYQYELYSLKKNNWREITRYPLRGGTAHSRRMPVSDSVRRDWIDEDGDDNRRAILAFDSLVSVGGVSYWMGHENGRRVIAAFDFSAEDFYSLPLPETGDGSPYMETQLMDYDGALSILAYNKYGSEKSFEVWVLNDESSWEKVSDFKVAGGGRPLQFWKKDALFFEGRDGELLLLDHAGAEELKHVGEYRRRATGRHGECWMGETELYRYVPSRFPLNNI